MRHSLHAHLLHLENNIQSLRDQLTGVHTRGERERLLAQLSAAEFALVRYREAYELELSVSVAEPSGDGSSGDKSTEDRPGPRGKKDTGTGGHMRKRRTRLLRRSVRFVGQHPGPQHRDPGCCHLPLAARMRLAMARASSHICTWSV